MVSADGLHSAGTPCSDCATFSLRHHFCSLLTQSPFSFQDSCFVWLWCVCIGRQDRLWVPEAGSIAILTSLVPVLCLAQSKQVWTVCRDCIIILLFSLAFFFFWRNYKFSDRVFSSFVSIVVPNMRLNLINFPTCISPRNGSHLLLALLHGLPQQEEHRLSEGGAWTTIIK